MAFVRVRTRRTKADHLQTYTELVQTWREGDHVRQRVLCNLYGHKAPELALLHVRTLLDRELINRQQQRADFRRGWRIVGSTKPRLQRLTANQIARERRESNRRIARLRKDLATLEHAIQRYPTPPELLRKLEAES
jgi:hypothetical protein